MRDNNFLLEGAPPDPEPPPTLEELQDATSIFASMQRLAREWTSPHQYPRSAGNFELLAMNVARYAFGCDDLIYRYSLHYRDWGELNHTVLDAEPDPSIAAVFQSCNQWWHLTGTVEGDAETLNTHTGEFIGQWLLGGFPRLEISHKYAAALCCTDCPDDLEVRAPWEAWSLVVPPDLLGPNTPARLWVIGTKWIGLLWHNGTFQPVSDTPATAVTAHMMENLIRGACLSLVNPEQHRKAGGKAHGKGNNRRGPPDLAQTRFLLAPPVSIDLRTHIAEAVAGRASTAPKVQFLVRGHWRQQAHGAGRAQRKTIWIEPFWKGPEDARVLLRQHKLH